jgi:trk system potassium uptake protein TrkH
MLLVLRSTLPVLHSLGLIVLIFAGTMLVPLAFALAGSDPGLPAYDRAILITAAAGVGLALVSRRRTRELLPRDGFLLVTLVWTVLPAFATLPLLFHLPGLSFTHAYFECISAMTTTGATVLSGLDDLPLSINVWRHLLQWIGGMGVLVLAVAILPMLGVGGAQVFRAETAGPFKETKLTPRIADTAKALYALYFSLSLACFLAYWAGGMSPSDAFMHMCSTMSLGGFSSHDASFGHFQSPLLEGIALVFMTLAGFNFSMHFLAWRLRSPLVYLRNEESIGYILLMWGAVFGVTAFLVLAGVYEEWGPALRAAAFNVVSIATTTGYATVDYGQWPAFAPILMLILGGVVTAAGSTGGGIKMVRFVVLTKQAMREFTRIMHPRAINPLTLDGNPVENKIIFSILAFMLIYGAVVTTCTMLLIISGMEPVTAVSAVLASVNCIGPGLNEIGPSGNYGGLTDFQLWVCAAAMLLGRLEMMSVLVLFTPIYWRG